MSGTMKFTDSPEQAAVIQAPSYEDVVVVAGAGSGKTYTMTRRIITLIEQGVNPEKSPRTDFHAQSGFGTAVARVRSREPQPA